jgi:hypothetical protein
MIWSNKMSETSFGQGRRMGATSKEVHGGTGSGRVALLSSWQSDLRHDWSL